MRPWCGGAAPFPAGSAFPSTGAGDSDSDYHGLFNTLRGGLSLGLTGFPFWSHDVGGYFGQPDADVYIRWLQVGMLSSHVRFHGTTPREPWHYGQAAVDAYKKYAAIRYSLLEHLYAVDTCTPLIRHLVLDFAGDHTVRSIDDQYMLGRNLLVAGGFDQKPLRRLYLPPGRWLDWHTGKILDGARWVDYLLSQYCPHCGFPQQPNIKPKKPRKSNKRRRLPNGFGHKTVRKPKEEWIRSEGTHEPLISVELWEQAQAIDRKNYKPRKRSDGTTSIFTGLIYCADCGFKMRNQNECREKKDGTEHRYSAFLCGNYARSGKTACTTHTISEDDLRELVIAHIRKCARMVEYDERRIVGEILARKNTESVSYRAAYAGELKSHRDRLTMLDKLIAKLYEDRVTGAVPEAVFHSLIQKYEQERVSRLQAAENLDSKIAAIREDTEGANTWAKLIKRYARLESFDAETLLLLVDRIIVSEAQKVNGRRVRDIEIVYNYVGNVDWLEETGEAERTVAEYGKAV